MRLHALIVLLAASLAAQALTLQPVAKRTAYQTNESIPLVVVRGSDGPGQLEVEVTGEGAAPVKLSFALAGGRAAEYLWLDGRLLQPGAYTVKVTADGESAETAIEVYSALRRSTFRLINWSPIRAAKKDAGHEENHLEQGEQKFGYNTVYSQGGGANAEALIRAGVDFIPNCVAGGGHQPELRMDCDWSDPYVLNGVVARGSRFALATRAYPNVPMIHLYDEPGLTWYKSPKTDEVTPHDVPTQVRAFEGVMGKPYLHYYDVDPNDPAKSAAWSQWAQWKLGFMEAAWRLCREAIEDVDPKLLVATQSQYGWGAFTDGYYFNVVRSLPVTSGHGGYHDLNLGYFTPSFFLVMARARDLDSPTWYLPTWYGNTTGDQLRAEQYLSLITGIQGLMTPPPLEPTRNKSAADAIAETNHLMARIGTIFDDPSTPRQPVAILYALSNQIHVQTADRTKNYTHETRHGQDLNYAYLACLFAQYQPQTVVEEDLLDGSVAANHRAVLVGGVDYLAPGTIAALAAFQQGGGAVLTFDSTVAIPGAVDLGVPQPQLPGQARLAEIQQQLQDLSQGTKEERKANADERKKLGEERGQLTNVAANVAAARPLRDKLVPALAKAGIAPILTSSVDTIVAGSRDCGDVTYYFAVNATPDGANEDRNALKAVSATIALPVSANLYDLVDGKPAALSGGKAKLDFIPGQLRAWAATAQPIAGVSLPAPRVVSRLAGGAPSITLQAEAMVLTAGGAPLSGPVPLRIELKGPGGAVLYDLYRSTSGGVAKVSLPLGANLPAGACTLTVTELLGGHRAEAAVPVKLPAPAGAVAGLEQRAIMLEGERAHLFRFGRRYREVTLVPGSDEASIKVAARLAELLAPWDIQCRTIPAAEANKPRPLTAEEASTWVGRTHTSRNSLKEGADNPIGQVGFNLDRPTIVLGSTASNPLIAFLADRRYGYLPWELQTGELPAPGRGYVAWQRDALQYNLESIALIGDDEAALTEAAGTLYEAIIGFKPLTRWQQPDGR